MISLPGAIIVGAATRNCGKTTFICSLLSRFRAHQPVAVKVKTLYPGDEQWHGSGAELSEPFIIRAESNQGHLADSQRMMEAGASEVFYVKSWQSNLSEALKELFLRIPDGCPLIFESNSVRDWIEPALFILIIRENSDELKPSAARLLTAADCLVKTDGARHNPAPSEIELKWNGNLWVPGS